MNKRRGFSLIELLVCMAIVGILMAMYLPALSKTMAKARALAGKEAIRQRSIGRLASPDTGNDSVRYSRQECQNAYRQALDFGKGETWVTELLYVVNNEAEFIAYWFTVIDPYYDEPLTYRGNSLEAYGVGGEVYYLQVVPYSMQDAFYDKGGDFPLMWEYLSTNMGDMSTDGMHLTVLMGSGEIHTMRYPDEYPICKTVAELSYAFLHE